MRLAAADCTVAIALLAAAAMPATAQQAAAPAADSCSHHAELCLSGCAARGGRGDRCGEVCRQRLSSCLQSGTYTTGAGYDITGLSRD
ncbi:MAG TPA: hypothetical protein VMB84_08145 [Stellaceae bacterium]|nr:hypothetical protein [Stellaceae bacterium]